MAENCSTLIGVIADVSGSMKRNIGDGVHEEGGEWIQSLFRVIDSLITHDVSDSNHMFAIGMGANNPRTIFDVLRTIEDFKNIKTNQTSLNHASTIDSILTILESAGACAVRKWASASAIGDEVSHDDAKKLLYYVKSRPGFAKGVVNSCLPNACKGIENNTPEFVRYVPFAHLLLRAGESAVSTFRPPGEKEIKDAIEKAKFLLEEDFLIREVDVQSSIFTVKEAWGILHGSVDKDKLTNQRVQELMDDVRPFIYGGSTPFYESLEKALQLFTFSQHYKDHKKLLLVISDGYPTDDPFFTKKDILIAKFREIDITIVSCFITRLHDDVEPKRLFSKDDYHLEDGAKLLFELSSKIPADLVPRTIFVKRGWKIDFTNNETKLFLQVNHPDILKDACDLARNVVCCQDALADVLTSVSLDIYINQSRNDFGAQEQLGGTSYANASAAVLHLSMKRILGRQGGYPEFDELRQEIIDEFGVHGAYTFGVLQSICPRYRLHCKQVDALGAMAAIAGKRPVVANFYLTDEEWRIFSRFFGRKPTGILTCKELDITYRPPHVITEGHAVVLTSYNSECLRLMNSWGVQWGDNGFFRIQDAHVLGLEFIDVFWTEDELMRDERIYYAKHGARKAAKFLQNLKGLQVLTHRCPFCRQESKVTEFTGQILSAKCPVCYQEFKCDETGNILALNMYLTSLSK